MDKPQGQMTQRLNSMVTIELRKIDTMDGYDFENYLAEILKKTGYIVSVTPKSGDKGLDIIAQKGENIYGIQVKRSKTKIGYKAVMEADAGIVFHNHCTQAMVVTNNYFNPRAIAHASKTNCLLVDRTKLKEWISDSLTSISSIDEEYIGPALDFLGEVQQFTFLVFNSAVAKNIKISESILEFLKDNQFVSQNGSLYTVCEAYQIEDKEENLISHEVAIEIAEWPPFSKQDLIQQLKVEEFQADNIIIELTESGIILHSDSFYVGNNFYQTNYSQRRQRLTSSGAKKSVENEQITDLVFQQTISENYSEHLGEVEKVTQFSPTPPTVIPKITVGNQFRHAKSISRHHRSNQFNEVNFNNYLMYNRVPLINKRYAFIFGLIASTILAFFIFRFLVVRDSKTNETESKISKLPFIESEDNLSHVSLSQIGIHENSEVSPIIKEDDEDIAQLGLSPEFSTNDLCNAIFNSDNERLANMLNSPNIHAIDGLQGNDFFMTAVQSSESHILLLLFESSISFNMNQPDLHGETPLHMVIEQGNLDKVVILLAMGADLSMKNSKGWSPHKLSKKRAPKLRRSSVERRLIRRIISNSL